MNLSHVCLCFLTDDKRYTRERFHRNLCKLDLKYPVVFKIKHSGYVLKLYYSLTVIFLFITLCLYLQLQIIFTITHWNNAICSQQACTWSIFNENVYFHLFDCQCFDLRSECAHFSSTDNAWVNLSVLSFLWLVAGVFGHLVLLDPVLFELVCVQMCPCMFKHQWICTPNLSNCCGVNFDFYLCTCICVSVYISSLSSLWESLVACWES